MNKKTEIVLVIDNSGSMSSSKTDMEGGLKAFLDKQKNQPGECYITQYNFSNSVEKKMEAVDVNSVNEIKINPMGMTALYDAIGHAIDEVGKRLEKTKKSERPDVVILCTVTDGAENSSKRYSAKDIKEKIQHQEQKYSWEFTFLGEGLDVAEQGIDSGFDLSKTMSYSKKGIINTVSILSDKVSLMRSGAASSICYSHEDRKQADI